MRPETATPETPLVPSRSLGRLLGLAGLWLKLETCQPGGSWLDRAAAAIVDRAARDGARGLALVGAGPLAVALATRAGRAGLGVTAFVPAHAASGPDAVWLVAVGGRLVPVAAGAAELAAALPDLAARLGLRAVDASDPLPRAGMRSVLAEIARQRGRADLVTLAVSAVDGREGAWLAADPASTTGAAPVWMAAGAEPMVSGAEPAGRASGAQEPMLPAARPLLDETPPARHTSQRQPAAAPAATKARGRAREQARGRAREQAGGQAAARRAAPPAPLVVEGWLAGAPRSDTGSDDSSLAREWPAGEPPAGAWPAGEPPAGAPPAGVWLSGEPPAGVLRLSVAARDAEAARRLLAREEGVLVSRQAAAALAALVRARRARQVSPAREVVLLLGERPADRSDGPPLAAEEIVPTRPVALADLCADPRRALVSPPV